MSSGQSNAGTPTSYTSVITCPTTIEVEHSLSVVPLGWDTGAGEQVISIPVAGASLYSGHPKASRVLRESRVRKKKEDKPKVLEFNYLSDHPNEIYVVCIYTETTVSVYKRIHPRPTACFVVYLENQRKLSEVRVLCE